MEKNKTNRLSAHLHYHWWKYILLTVVSVFVWTSVFDILEKPAKNETVGIVFFGEDLDAAALHQELTNAVSTLTQQEISHIDVSETFADTAQLGQLLMARSNDCDLLIIPENLVDQIAAYGFFMPLPESLQGDDAYCQEKDGISTAYGLEIYKPGMENRFSAFCSGEQTYYVFCSKESVNLAGLNGKGNKTDDAALRILAYLLEEPNGSNAQN